MALAPDPFRIALDTLYPPVNPYVDDPAGWVAATTKEHLWSDQVRIMESVRDNRRTAVPACHGPGKSFSAARLAAWWLTVHPPNTAFVVTTAPTDAQVKAILWREITRAHRKGKLNGRVTLDAQWKINDELVAYGRKPADHDEDAFQGIHARYVLVILDEACGIPKQLWTGASTLMTNEDARIVAIGNPDNPLAEFATICDGVDPVHGGLSARGWNVIPISAMSTPNFTGEAIPEEMRYDLTSHLWCDEFAQDMGGPALLAAHRALVDKVTAGLGLAEALAALDDDTREIIMSSPLYVSKVLGQFPTDTTDGVILWSWIRQCVGEEAVNRAGELHVPRQIGADIGGSETGDETVVYEMAGRHVGRRWSIRSADPEKVASKVEAAIREAKPDCVNIDSIGIGWGVMGMIRRTFPDLKVNGVNVAEAAFDAKRFENLRSEIWWDVGRALCKDRAWDLTRATEATLAQLAAPRWHESKTGRVVIERKDDIRERTGRSPDDADALLLAAYKPQAGREVTETEYEDDRLDGRR